MIVFILRKMAIMKKIIDFGLDFVANFSGSPPSYAPNIGLSLRVLSFKKSKFFVLVLNKVIKIL